jgi:hypothetical protein
LDIDFIFFTQKNKSSETTEGVSTMGFNAWESQEKVLLPGRFSM